MRFKVFRQIVSMDGATLPIARTLTDFTPLIAEDYAGKTAEQSGRLRRLGESYEHGDCVWRACWPMSTKRDEEREPPP